MAGYFHLLSTTCNSYRLCIKQTEFDVVFLLNFYYGNIKIKLRGNFKFACCGITETPSHPLAEVQSHSLFRFLLIFYGLLFREELARPWVGVRLCHLL